MRNGKNTEFLQTKAKHLIGADFSEEMLERAKAKITAENVEFRHSIYAKIGVSVKIPLI